jgi:hypothetical protein
MTISSTATALRKVSRAARAPLGGLTFERLMAVLSVALVAGLYLDGWAHEHGRVDQTFFTPWHAVLYSAFFLNGLVLGIVFLLNHRRGCSWFTALPKGYALSFLGTPLFMLGGLGDLIWHTLFGFEVGIAPLLSPTHLLLALSGFFIMSGPLRAAWSRSESRHHQNWATLLPPLLSLCAVFSLFTFFTTYTHPLVITRTITASPYQEVNGSLGVTGVLLQAALLMGCVLLAVRRWHLPLGTLTLMFTLNAALMSVLKDTSVLIPAVLLAGMLADLLYACLQPSVKRPTTLRPFAFFVPFIYMLALFLTIIGVWGTPWTIHLWLGVCMLSGVVGLLMSYVLVPPAIPSEAEQEE